MIPIYLNVKRRLIITILISLSGAALTPIQTEIKVQLVVPLKRKEMGYGQYFSRFVISLYDRGIFSVRWLKIAKTHKLQTRIQIDKKGENAESV
jgi:hypothetical protein